MDDVHIYDHIFAAFAFVLGSVVGSFLNVCIYRLPRDLSVNEPKRSFCPHCQYQIPFSQNIPLFSWLLLRGRCAHCKAPISFRYFGVELLTGLLFLAAWEHAWHSPHWEVAFPLWILLSLMVTATFIDFEHFIIPDEITWGGVVTGLICSALFPALLGQDTHLLGLLWSLLAAASGYGTLWFVVEAGKLAFGRKKTVLAKAEDFTWVRENDDADFSTGEEKMRWSDVFPRLTDRLLMQVTEAAVDGKAYPGTTLTFYYNRLLIGEETYDLDKVDRISGRVTEFVMPREAMGFGDVKFIAAIGAFLGVRAVFFSIVCGSMLGALVGLAMILIGKRQWSAWIPFGPYLALGALIWIFAGPQILQAYWNSILPPP